MGTDKKFGKQLGGFLAVDEATSGTVTYTGFEANTGRWYIMKYDSNNGQYRYAAGSSGYSAAWSNRASETYGIPSATFNS